MRQRKIFFVPRKYHLVFKLDKILQWFRVDTKEIVLQAWCTYEVSRESTKSCGWLSSYKEVYGWYCLWILILYIIDVLITRNNTLDIGASKESFTKTLTWNIYEMQVVVVKGFSKINIRRSFTCFKIMNH